MPALQIDNPRAQALAAELARQTGESVDDAVIRSIEQRLAREKAREAHASLVHDLKEISRRAAALPVLDDRDDDEILGYDKSGTLS